MTGILTDITNTFHMTESQSGLLQTAFVLVYMIMAPVFGYLGDRFSRKYLMAVGIFFWCLATLVGSFMPVSAYFDGLFLCFFYFLFIFIFCFFMSSFFFHLLDFYTFSTGCICLLIILFTCFTCLPFVYLLYMSPTFNLP